MNNTSEPRQSTPQPDPLLVGLLVLVVGLVAWPSIVGGIILYWVLKRWQISALTWFVLAFIGVAGGWLMFLETGYLPAFQAMIHALPAYTQWSVSVGLQFVERDLIPLWLRSLLTFPLATALFEMLLPKTMETRLRDQEHHMQIAQERVTRHAKRRLARTPEQIKGQAVLGVLVKDPSDQ